MPSLSRLSRAARPAFVAAMLVVAAAAPAHAEKWVGNSYSDSGGSVKIVLGGPTWYGGDGTVGFSGRGRCVGFACLNRRGLVSVMWWNAADGFGWQAVKIDHADGSTCTSLAYFLTPFYTLPPPVGTTINVPYQCANVGGYLLDSGRVALTRRR